MLFTVNAVNTNNVGTMRIMGMRQMMQEGNGHEEASESEEMTMHGMVDALEEKSGDEFDKAFIGMMIVHHRGAIDMAKNAKAQAKHEELRKLADDIITAQTKEIEMMRKWLKDWGY